MQKEDLEKKHERINEVPFDSDRKMMSTVHTYNESYYSMTKGAIDKLYLIVPIFLKTAKLRF